MIFLELMITAFNFLQFWNAFSPINVVLAGIVTLRRAEHPAKAYFLIVVTPLPIVTEVKDVIPWKAYFPM